MKIAILGAGGVGTSLGRTWTGKGHEVRYGARNAQSDKVKAALAATPGAQAVSIAEAVKWAEAVVLATPWSGAQEAVTAGGDFGGKPLLDATNPLTPTFGLALGHTDSGGEQVQRWAPTAKVVKIFNTTALENMANPVYPQGHAAMVYAGDDAGAKEAAKRLATDLGFEALDMGGLTGARYLEPAAMVWIHLALVQKLGRGIAFGLMRR
ncbi:MAG TPA: NAD(P)-binding domain-containing protein [Ramlibacter sp.]|nr:NAD(P)-binding domain-containing protein [Ramlibacter sp.]